MQQAPFHAALALILCAVPGLARNPGDLPKPGFNVYSKQQDIEIGKEAAARVLQQYQQVQNRDLQAYVKKIGERLAKTPTASGSGFPFSFTLLNYKEVNAFALPGGPTFMFTGLINASGSEAELAGVLAHEISHVALRHGTHQASKANIIARPALLIGALNSLTLLGRLINVGLGLGLNGVFLKNSREAEAEADALGTHIMSEAGYDPVALAQFFEKLEAQGGPGVPEFLSDHPNPGNRIEAVEAEARTLPHRVYTSDNHEFDRVKVAIAKLPAPPDLRPKDIGIVSANAAGYNKLSTAQFSIEYPSTWHVLGDSESALIALAPNEGIATGASGEPAIGYGSVLSYFFADPSRSSLGEATDDLIQRLRAEDPGVHRSGQQTTTEAGKHPALITPLSSDSPFGGAETDMLLTVARPEGLFHLIFISPERNWGEAHLTFEHMVQSIRFVQ
ncbi:MAG: M48 family metallopeptidase [Bryobacteraceae bacterium]|jgi:predicted Zn-dependent protease